MNTPHRQMLANILFYGDARKLCTLNLVSKYYLTLKKIQVCNVIFVTYLQSEGIDETSGISREESPRFKLYSSRAAEVLKSYSKNISMNSVQTTCTCTRRNSASTRVHTHTTTLFL